MITSACNKAPEHVTAPEEREASPPRSTPSVAKDVVNLDPGEQKAAGIETQTIKAMSIAMTVTAPGQLVVDEDRTWTVGALTEGRVVEISAKLGDQVREGQVLGRIHSHDVHDTRAEYRKAQEEVQRAEAAEAVAGQQRDRAQRLFDLKAVSREQLENAGQELRNAQAVTRNARVAVEKARVHLEDYLDVPVEGDEHEPPVKAPASGLVIERKATPGMVVTPGQELFRLTDPLSLWLIASVNEADLASLRTGQQVRVQVRAYGDRSFSGRILRLGEELDPETRTLKVRVHVPNPGSVLKPGMFATAEIRRESSRPALFAPQSAVQEVNGQQCVFLQTGDRTFAVRPILLGAANDGQVEITGGLKAGDRVVTKGAFLLKSHLLKGSLAE
jgi:cobalt-zinc-cadmium efflux system membrane fusion protein